MASEDAARDADRSSSRLSSFSLYDDPPLTNPDLVKRQLDLELQLRTCIEKLIKEYLDTDSFDRVEELTGHQLSCCGRIAAHRLQLLRLRRSQSLPDQWDLENVMEQPQDLLNDDIASGLKESTVESAVKGISTSSDTMETTKPMTNSWWTDINGTNNSLMVKADSLTNNAIDAELTEIVETVVNKAITNATIQLVEEISTTISLPSVDACNEKETNVLEVKTNVENTSTIPPNAHTIEAEFSKENRVVTNTTESEDAQTTEAKGNGVVTNTTESEDAQTTEAKGNEVVTNTTEENESKGADITEAKRNGVVTNTTEENESKGADITEAKEDILVTETANKNESTNAHTTEAEEGKKTTENVTEVSEERTITQDTPPNLIKKENAKYPVLPSEPHTSTQNVPDAIKPITEKPVAVTDTGTHVINDEPVKHDMVTKENEIVKEKSSKSELASNPMKSGHDSPNNENSLPNTQPAKAIIQQSKSLEGLSNCNQQSAASPSEVIQGSGLESNVQYASVNKPSHNKKPSKARTLDFRTTSVDQKSSKKLKTFTKSRSPSAAVIQSGTISTYEWDPTCLLEELYIDCKPIAPPGIQPSRLMIEMEKLPRNQVKKTIAKGWKKRYFCITSGSLYYYEDKKMAKALGVVKLNGAKVVCEDSVIKVTDKLNQTIAIRGKPDDTYQMYRSLHLESVHPTLASVVSPYPGSGHPVIIVDIGSCSVRAGFAQGEAYPRLFFPAVCSIVKDTDEIQSCGFDALTPLARQNCEIVFPTRHKLRMDQETSVPIRYIHFFLLHIFKELKVEPSSAKVIMTLPQNYTEKDKEFLMEVLLENLSCEAACLLEQSLLSLYSYGATSGIIVDIGERTDIIPIVDGFKIESGVTKLKIGGANVTDSLRRLSTEYGLRYFSDVEFYAMRLIKEKIGFVSQDFGTDLEQSGVNAASYKRALEVAQYQLPDRKTVIALDSPLFRALEGFFQPSLWGMDIPSIPESVWKAIQACDVNSRREMSRSIFLSGGATLTTGFQERLEQELTSLAPSSYTIQVQASVSRYHAAFLGAAVLASLDSFQDSWITKEDFIRLKI